MIHQQNQQNIIIFIFFIAAFKAYPRVAHLVIGDDIVSGDSCSYNGRD